MQSPLEVQRPGIYISPGFVTRQAMWASLALMGENSEDEFALGCVLSGCKLKTTAPGAESNWNNLCR